MDRRSLLKSALLLAGAGASLPLDCARAATEPDEWRHGVARLGALKYQPGFPHFGYTNVGAPKGGEARIIALGSFDTFNIAGAGMTEIQSALFDDWRSWPEERFGLHQLVSSGERLTRTSFAKARTAGGTVIIHGRSEEQTRAAIASPMAMIMLAVVSSRIFDCP